MAIPDIQAEEEKEKDENGKLLTNEATPQTPGLGLPTSQKSGSGTFTNLRDYLSANQKRVGQISGTLASGVTNEASKIRGDIAKSRESTLGGQSAIGSEENRLGGAETGIEQTIAGAGQTQPQGLGLSEFQQYSKGTTGFQPETLDFGKQKLSVDEYQQRIGRLGQPGGQFDAIQSYLTKGAAGYTRGQSKLDQALLSRDPNVRTQLSTAAQAGKVGTTSDQYENIQKEYQDRVTAAEQRRNELAEFTSGTGVGLTDEEKIAMKDAGKTDIEILQADIARKYGKLGTAGHELESTIAQKQANEIAAQEALQKSIRESFGGETPDYALSQAELDRLGAQDLVGTNLYDIAGEIPTYGYNPTKPEFSQMASPQDLARAQALARLAGGYTGDNTQFDLIGDVEGVFDPSKVTSEGYKDVGFGREAFDAQLKGAQERYSAGQDFYGKQQQAMVNAEKQAFSAGPYAGMGGFSGLSATINRLAPSGLDPNNASQIQNLTNQMNAINTRIRDARDEALVAQYGSKDRVPREANYGYYVQPLYPSEVKRLYNAMFMDKQIQQGTLPQYYEQNIKSRGPKLGVQ